MSTTPSRLGKKVYSGSSVQTNSAPSAAEQLCLIVGLTCLVGFAVDLFVLSLPLSLGNVQWRVNLMQQVGDRSIVLFVGLALLIYSQLSNVRFTRMISLACLSIGVALILSNIIVIRDSLVLRDRTFENISAQAQQLQSQIEQSRNSAELSPNFSEQQLDQAAQQVTGQADQLRQNARAGITKAGLASLGNLLVMGLGLVGLGRFGLRHTRRTARG